MKITTVLPLAAIALTAGAAAAAASPRLYEEEMARDEMARIIERPIAGIRNARWFDYRTDIGEARKELASDLRGASDLEDRRDAWEEYAHELRNERVEYVQYMAKRGHRYGRVIWDN